MINAITDDKHNGNGRMGTKLKIQSVRKFLTKEIK
jgi:hypothetical protein